MTLALNVILKLLTGVSAKEYPHAVEDMRNKTEIAFKAGRVTGIEVVYPSLRRFFHNDIVEASFLAIQTFFKVGIVGRNCFIFFLKKTYLYRRT